MKRWIYSSTSGYKVLTQEDVEKLKKAIKENRFYSCWTRLGKKYIKDTDMYQYFESQLEGQSPATLSIEQFDELIYDELENEYVHDVTENNDDYLDQPLPVEIQTEIDRIQSTYPQLEVTIVVDDWYGDSVNVYNTDSKATVNEDLEKSVDDVSVKKFKSVLNRCVKEALSRSHNKGIKEEKILMKRWIHAAKDTFQQVSVASLHEGQQVKDMSEIDPEIRTVVSLKNLGGGKFRVEFDDNTYGEYDTNDKFAIVGCDTSYIKGETTRDRIYGLQARIDDLRSQLADPDLADDERVDIGLELAALEDELNFAWQDDEAEYNYALRQQEFNPDGSLKGYDDIYGAYMPSPLNPDDFFNWYDGLDGRMRRKVDDLAKFCGLPAYEDCKVTDLAILYNSFN